MLFMGIGTPTDQSKPEWVAPQSASTGGYAIRVPGRDGRRTHQLAPRRERTVVRGCVLGARRTARRGRVLLASLRTWSTSWNKTMLYIWRTTADGIFDGLARYCRLIND